MNTQTDLCWLCQTDPVRLALAQQLAERVALNMRLRTGSITAPAECSDDEAPGEVNRCPECGASVLSHSSIAGLHARLNRVIEEWDDN